MTRILAIPVLALLLAAPASTAPTLAADLRGGIMRSDGFDLVAFFSRPTSGRGRSRAVNGVEHWDVVTRPVGRVGSAFRMNETLRYDEGEDRLQAWTIRPTPGGGFVATRPDLDGPALFRPAGAGRLKYRWTQYLDARRRRNTVTLRGELRLRPNGSVENVASVWKYAVPIGRVRVMFHPARG